MTTTFSPGDEVKIVRSQIKSRNGLVGTITNKAFTPIYGPNSYWVQVDHEAKEDGSTDTMYVVEAEAMDLHNHKSTTEEKLAEIVKLLELIELNSDTSGVDSEWMKGNIYGANNTAKAIRQILEG